MDKAEKKIAKKLSQGQLDNIKAANEVIDTIIGLAEEEISLLEHAIAEEEENKTTLPSDKYLETLNNQLDYFQKVVKNGNLLLEQREIAEELLDLYNEYDD